MKKEFYTKKEVIQSGTPFVSDTFVPCIKKAHLLLPWYLFERLKITDQLQNPSLNVLGENGRYFRLYDVSGLTQYYEYKEVKEIGYYTEYDLEVELQLQY